LIEHQAARDAPPVAERPQLPEARVEQPSRTLGVVGDRQLSKPIP
jgi:hypothetical protein